MGWGKGKEGVCRKRGFLHMNMRTHGIKMVSFPRGCDDGEKKVGCLFAGHSSREVFG